MQTYIEKERDAAKMLSLFGCLDTTSEARRLLGELAGGCRTCRSLGVTLLAFGLVLTHQGLSQAVEGPNLKPVIQTGDA